MIFEAVPVESFEGFFPVRPETSGVAATLPVGLQSLIKHAGEQSHSKRVGKLCESTLEASGELLGAALKNKSTSTRTVAESILSGLVRGAGPTGWTDEVSALINKQSVGVVVQGSLLSIGGGRTPSSGVRKTPNTLNSGTFFWDIFQLLSVSVRKPQPVGSGPRVLRRPPGTAAKPQNGEQQPMKQPEIPT